MINDGLNTNNSKITSFLMIGQSNMAGRGRLKDINPIDNNLCFMLKMGRWQKMSEPINTDRAIFCGKFSSGISLAASFADEYAKYTSQSVGLIPCADGGTKIEQWMPGEILFDHAVFMTKLAMRTSKLGGIIWHQGESDCHIFDGYTYKKRLILFFLELRKQIGIKNLPIIMGEISEKITDEWNVNDNPPKLNKILAEVADEIPNIALAKSDGLNLQDGIHFTSKSSREYGKRYFEKYKKLTII